jgi:hypothetical protein
MRLSFCQEFVTVLCSDHRYPDRGIILQTFEQITEFLDGEHGFPFDGRRSLRSRSS